MRSFAETEKANERRFWEKCDMRRVRPGKHSEDCWIWISTKDRSNGQPLMWLYRPDGTRQLVNARRYAWNLNREVPLDDDEILICFCENRGERKGKPPYDFAICVNPWHHIQATRKNWRHRLQEHLDRLEGKEPGTVVLRERNTAKVPTEEEFLAQSKKVH